MLNLCEHVMAQVCTDFGATLAEFNPAEDHVHLLMQYPPKVALSPRQLPQRHLIQADAAGLRRQNQQGSDPRQVLVPVILPRIMRWPATAHRQGLHRRPETTRPGKDSSLP